LTKLNTKVSGNSPAEVADWYARHSPEVDRLGIEANVLLNRVYMQIAAKNEVGKESLFTSGRFNVLSLLDRAGSRGLLMSEIAAGISISITNLPKLMLCGPVLSSTARGNSAAFSGMPVAGSFVPATRANSEPMFAPIVTLPTTGLMS